MRRAHDRELPRPRPGCLRSHTRRQHLARTQKKLRNHCTVSGPYACGRERLCGWGAFSDRQKPGALGSQPHSPMSRIHRGLPMKAHTPARFPLLNGRRGALLVLLATPFVVAQQSSVPRPSMPEVTARVPVEDAAGVLAPASVQIQWGDYDADETRGWGRCQFISIRAPTPRHPASPTHPPRRKSSS